METDTTPELVSAVYLKLNENITKYRKIVGRSLTLTEKILSGHFHKIDEKNFTEEKTMYFLNLTELHYKM